MRGETIGAWVELHVLQIWFRHGEGAEMESIPGEVGMGRR